MVRDGFFIFLRRGWSGIARIGVLSFVSGHGYRPHTAASAATGRRTEEMALGTREIYVHYGDGMADSKLKIPAAKTGTARNMNTIATLVDWATE